MLDTKSYDIVSPGYNYELVEVIERTWIKSSATTKEQKEKNLHDIFLAYINRLNKSLKENESADIADLIMEKSVYLTEVTGVQEWPRVETLKVADLHRLTLFLYNYCKYKISMAYGNMKVTKDLAFKAFENLAKFLELLMEMSSFELSEELLFSVYNDMFDCYIKSREFSQNDEQKDKTKEDMGMIIDMIYEETNVKSLLKMNQIEKSAQRSLFTGLLTLILEFKIHKYEKEEDRANKAKSGLDDIYKHLELIRQMSTVVYYEYNLVRSAFHFSTQVLETSYFKDLLIAFKHFKSNRKFRRSIALNQFFSHFENCAKYLLLLYLVAYGIKIDSNILSFLKISNIDLINLNLQNSILIESLLNSSSFTYLLRSGLLSHIRNEMNKIFQKNSSKTFLPSEQIEEIYEIIYEKKSFLKFNKSSEVAKDSLNVASDFNSMFKNLRKMIDNIN